MDYNELNHKQKNDYRKNSASFGYLYARGYINFGRFFAYLTLKSVLLMFLIMLITDAFFLDHATAFHRYISEFIYNLGGKDIAAFLYKQVPAPLFVGFIAFPIVTVWHLAGFVIGMEEDWSKENLDQFR